MQSRLLVPNCPHAGHALFSAHYLRSNRTRAPKVLRCFPHCCPGHRARSYCGAPIHVEVSLAAPGADSTTGRALSTPRERQYDNDQVGNDPELVVYGHFERESGDEETRADLAVGQQVRLQDLLANGSSWVRGLASTTTDGRRARVFTFNDDEYCHWLYDWNSGTSQRERARLHYFRVYVFQCAGRSSSSSPSGSSTSTSSSSHSRRSRPTGPTSQLDSEIAAFQWQVVDVISSPGFTISAFRKEASTPSAGEPATPVEANPPSPLPPPGHGILSHSRIERHRQHTAGSTRYYQPQQQLSGYERLDLLAPYEQGASFLAQWTRAHPEAVAKSTRLALVALVLSQLDVNWLDPAQFSSNLFGLLRQWPGDVSSPPSTQRREDTLWHFANYVAPKLLSLLGAAISSVSGPSPSLSPSPAGLQQAAEFAELGFSLFCHLVDESQWGDLRNALLRDAVDSVQFDETTLDDAERVTTAAAAFQEALELQTSAWLARCGLSIESLVDDLVSCVLMDRTRLELFPATLARHVLALLRNEELLGLDLLVRQFDELREAAARHLSAAAGQPSRFAEFAGAEGQSTVSRRCRLNGEWVCRAMDVDHVDPRARAASPSRAHTEPNARIRMGAALFSLLLAAGFRVELKDVSSASSDTRRRHYPSEEGGPGGGGGGRPRDYQGEEGGIADDERQPTRLQLEVTALMSLFPDVRERLELDGDLRALPAFANGLASPWLGALAFPFDDGVVDYSAYAMAATAPTSSQYGAEGRRQDTGGGGGGGNAGLELFLSFFYYANDGSAYRFRVGLSEDPSSTRGSDRLSVFVQAAVGSIDRSSGAVPDRVDWRRASPRERHAQIGAWESLAAFHLLYDRVVRSGQGDDPMAARDDGGHGQSTASSAFPLHPRPSRHSHRDGGFALV